WRHLRWSPASIFSRVLSTPSPRRKSAGALRTATMTLGSSPSVHSLAARVLRGRRRRPPPRGGAERQRLTVVADPQDPPAIVALDRYRVVWRGPWGNARISSEPRVEK